MNLNKIATVGEDGDADYFWKSDHEVLWLRHAFQHDKPPVIVFDLKSPEHIPPPPGNYEALVLDTATGAWQPLEAFNTSSAPWMTAKSRYVRCAGEEGAVVHHHPPACALSPNGDWLVWNHQETRGQSEWIAANLDGTLTRSAATRSNTELCFCCGCDAPLASTSSAGNVSGVMGAT